MESVAVDSFITYEDYLDAQITALDRRYLADDDLARQLVGIVRCCSGYAICTGGHRCTVLSAGRFEKPVPAVQCC